MECCCYLRNIQDRLSDGKTPHGRRFGEPFQGPIIPFGLLVEYHPISTKCQSRIHQFRKKVLLGIFLGCVLYAEKIWKGLWTLWSWRRWTHQKSMNMLKERINAKNVILHKGGCYKLTVADGTAPQKMENSHSQSQHRWADSMECHCYLRNIQDRLSEGKTTYERRFGEPFEGQIIPFGSLVELSSHIRERSVKNPSIWKESAPTFIPRLCIVRGEESGRETYWLWTLRSGKRWTHRKSMLKDSTRKR